MQPTSYSQAGQDVFVLKTLNNKKNGIYLELGCWMPKEINNTYLLETEYEWTGLSYDIDPHVVGKFNEERKNDAFVQDATQIDWDMIIARIGNKIDYLSLDLEPATVSLLCLQSIPFDKISFSVVTFEHDQYRYGDVVRLPSREIFERNGYKLVAPDVAHLGNIFEDWWIKL